ncbi:hypothetical protein PRIC1_007894 [Phytophthora ramorum]
MSSEPWTLDECGDLVTAWELAASRSASQNLYDAVYKHFVALRGGSTRRNKAALTSKRSALKFSYLYLRDFDAAQKVNRNSSYFELPQAKRQEVMKDWKKANASVVEITPVMFQALGRIVSKGGDEEPMRRRQKELQEATGPRETRASTVATTGQTVSSTAKAKAKKKQPRAPTGPWSHEEMRQLVQAWGMAAEMVCASTSNEPMSIVHEMYREFEKLQGGKIVRNLSGLATRRRVLKLSYSRISAFNKVQEMNGAPKFTDLPVSTRLNVIRSWKNANLLDLSAELYAELDKVILMDTRAVALEDTRRAKAGATKNSNAQAGRKPGKSSKKQRVGKLVQESKEDDVESVFSSQPPSVVEDSDEEKAAIPMMVVQSRTGVDEEDKSSEPAVTGSYAAEETAASLQFENVRPRKASSFPVANDSSALAASKPSVEEMYPYAKAVADEAKPTPPPIPPQEFAASNPAVTQDDSKAKALSPPNGSHDVAPLVLSHDRSPQKTLLPTSPRNPTQDVKTSKLVELKSDQSDLQKEPPNSSTPTVTYSKGPGRWGKRKRKVQPDGANGHFWGNAELEILVKAWEKAAILVCNSDPAERLSLNREMYREFVEMQGGFSVRNSTALAARRSSLKFSYAHIDSFNESQKAKGEPSYHEIPEEIRMSVLRSWKNRNSVDLSKDMFDGLRRIFAMDENLAEVRSLRPPPVPHQPKKKITVAKEPKEPKAASDHVSKTAKWSTEESSDLIKACADVMNGPTDKDQSATERESQIYDRFVARRQNAGDTDTPIRRDLRSMAQQWRYILASYAYIKGCNDNRSEAESPSWFDMSPMQKRAYQQCTNVPLKFVDLDADMLALVTETSFDGVVATPLPSPAVKTTSDGISLRPRSTRKKTEAFWSSDSESSVTSVPTAIVKRGDKDPVLTVGKKGNNWPAEELWNLIQAWEDASGLAKTSKLTSALNETFEVFTKLQEGSSNRNRSIHSVRNKMIALKSSFTGISTFIADRGDSAAWFDMTPDQRLAEIRTWNNKTIMDLSMEIFDALARILHRKTSEAYLKAGKRKPGKPPQHSAAHTRDKSHAGQKPEKYVAANWSNEELLVLGEACGELLEGRRTRRYVFEEEKDRFYRRYEELGGTNSTAAAVGLARFVLDSYEFVYFYNLKAAETNCATWFELDPADRDPIIARMSKSYRSFNGLTNISEELFDIIDGIDAELRLKLGETKKKTYKPPNDAASSRYVDIEAVVERCVFKKRTHPGPKNPVAREDPVVLEAGSASSEADASSPESLSGDEASVSDSGAPATSSIVARPASVAQPDEDVVAASPKLGIVRRGSNAARIRAISRSRKRARDTDNSSSTLYLTEIIQEQNRKLEKAVKRFRKDSSDARKEHHDFLLRKIQDSFPVDRGTGSFLERVAERQGQTLVEIFQRLHQQRDAEKAKDEELMHQLFGRSERA